MDSSAGTMRMSVRAELPTTAVLASAPTRTAVVYDQHLDLALQVFGETKAHVAGVDDDYEESWTLLDDDDDDDDDGGDVSPGGASAVNTHRPLQAVGKEVTENGGDGSDSGVPLVREDVVGKGMGRSGGGSGRGRGRGKGRGNGRGKGRPAKGDRVSVETGRLVPSGIHTRRRVSRKPVIRQEMRIRLLDSNGQGSGDVVNIIIGGSDRETRAAGAFNPDEQAKQGFRDELIRIDEQYQREGRVPFNSGPADAVSVTMSTGRMPRTTGTLGAGMAAAAPSRPAEGVFSWSGANPLVPDPEEATRATSLYLRDEATARSRIYAMRTSFATVLPRWLQNGVPDQSIDRSFAAGTRATIKRGSSQTAMTIRKDTEGSQTQATRIHTGNIERTEAAQRFAVEKACAAARWQLRQERGQDTVVNNPYALATFDTARAVEPAYTEEQCASGEASKLVAVAASAALGFDSMPLRLRSGGIRQEAERLARGELDPTQRLLSSNFGDHSSILDKICRSVLCRSGRPSVEPSMPESGGDGKDSDDEEEDGEGEGEGEDDDDDENFDCMWASVVLLCYTMHHLKGRALLSRSLTALDVVLAQAFESWGATEGQRRAKYEPRRQQLLYECIGTTAEEFGYWNGAWTNHPSGFDDEDGEVEEEADDSNIVPPSRRVDAPAGSSFDVPLPPPKRARRTAATPSASAGADGEGTLQLWNFILQSDHRHVLYNALAAIPEVNEVAAASTLARQAILHPCVSDEQMHLNVVHYAGQVRQASMALFSDEEHGKPRMHVVRVAGRRQPQLCIERSTPSIALHRLHAAESPTPGRLGAPPASTGIALLWSVASAGIGGDHQRDAFAYPLRVKMRAALVATLRQHQQRGVSCIDRRILHLERAIGWAVPAECDDDLPLPPELSGVSRSWVVVRTRLGHHSADTPCVESIVRTMRRLLLSVSESPSYVEAATSTDSEAAERAEVHVLASSELPSATNTDPSIADELVEEGLEPLLTPVDAFTVCIRAQQIILPHNMGSLVQRGRQTAAREPGLHTVCASHPSEITSDGPPGDSEPAAIVPITDFSIEQRAPIAGSDIPCTISLQTAAHRARRLSDVVDELRRAAEHVTGSAGRTERYDAKRAALSLLVMGTTQALLTSDQANKLAAVDTSHCVRGTKRMNSTDVTFALFLTLENVYVGGRDNMRSTNRRTPWVGQVGSGVDCGITPLGTDARNQVADCRKHGTMCMTQEVANVLSMELARGFYVHLPDENGSGSKPRRYAAPPTAMRGVPRMLLRGVAAALTPLDDALEKARLHFRSLDVDVRPPASLGRAETAADPEGDEYVHDLLVLVFTPYAQQPAPTCGPGVSDAVSQKCVRPTRTPIDANVGRQYIIDSTEDSRSIGVGTPRLRQPSNCARRDNYFSTAVEEPMVLFATFTLLARTAQLIVPRGTAPEKTVDALFTAIDRYHHDKDLSVRPSVLDEDDDDDDEDDDEDDDDDDDDDDTPAYDIAAHACILLNIIYPVTWAINAPMVQLTHSKATPACLRAAASRRGAVRGHRGAPLEVVARNSRTTPGATPTGNQETDELARKYRTGFAPSRAGAWPTISEDEVGSARDWWSRFRRTHNGAWTYGVRPILLELIRRDGTYDVGALELKEMRDLLDRSICAAWMVHSVDGTSPPPKPCPAHRAFVPTAIRNDQVDPQFVGRDDGSSARGALVGMKLFQARQLLVMLDAFHIIPFAQSYRLDGQMTHRVSMDPCLFKKDGTPRSRRATNPTAQDQCDAAHGSMTERIRSCSQQRAAWDSNTLLMMPLFTEVVPPHSLARRRRGAFGAAQHRLAREMELHAGAMESGALFRTWSSMPIAEARMDIERALLSGTTHAA
jgi:hypothetical protein